MKTLEEQLATYQAYHHNKWNVLTHYIGIPVIIIGLFIPMGWLRFQVSEFSVSFAMIFFLVVLIYYGILDLAFATGMIFFVGIMLVIAESFSIQGIGASWLPCIYFFVGGWIIQFIGHIFEGRQPAFIDNVIQLLIGPLYLWAKIVYFVGIRKDQKNRIMEASKNY